MTVVAVPATAIAAIAAVVAVAAGCGGSGDGAGPAPERLLPSGAPQARCSALLARLPAIVDGRPRRDAEGATTWVHGRGGVALACGVPRPAGLSRQAQVFQVDTVSWFAERLDAGATRYTAVDRRPYVALVVTAGVAPDRALVPVGSAVAAALQAAPLDLRR